MRPRHLFCSLLLAAVVLAAAGCGGATTYSAAKTRACLSTKSQVTAVPPDDLVATTAEGDSFSVKFPDNLVTLSFGANRKGAEQIVRAYQRFHGKNIGLEDALRASHNAVMLWAIHPKDEYLQLIEGCLK